MKKNISYYIAISLAGLGILVMLFTAFTAIWEFKLVEVSYFFLRLGGTGFLMFIIGFLIYAAERSYQEEQDDHKE